MKIRIIPVAAGLAGATALAVTGAALANADTGTTGTSTGAIAMPAAGSATGTPDRSQPPMGNGNTDPSKPMRSDEKLLSGTTASKVTAAARAKEPGATIQRVETDSGGVYEAHMVRADGTPIIVQVGKDFSVTGVVQGGPDGSGGRPGQGGSGQSSASTAPSST